MWSLGDALHVLLALHVAVLCNPMYNSTGNDEDIRIV